MLKITFLLLLASLIGGGVLYYKVKTQEETILSLKTQNSILKDDLTEAKEEIYTLEEAHAQLQDQLDQISALTRHSAPTRSRYAAGVASFDTTYK
jgi:predicted RNase H-like nuclease (RuvC/YqgF family)